MTRIHVSLALYSFAMMGVLIACDASEGSDPVSADVGLDMTQSMDTQTTVPQDLGQRDSTQGMVMDASVVTDAQGTPMDAISTGDAALPQDAQTMVDSMMVEDALPTMDALSPMDASQEMDALNDLGGLQDAQTDAEQPEPEPEPVRCAMINQAPDEDRGDGQFWAPVTRREMGPDDSGNDTFLRVQTTPDQHLLFPVNASFFTYGGALLLGGEGPENAPSAEALNRSRTYAYAERWNREGAGIMWGLHLAQAGPLVLEVEMGVDDTMAGAEVEISFGAHRATCITESTGGIANRRILWRMEFDGSPGQHTLSLIARNVPGNGVGRIYQAHLTGPGAEDAQLIRARWRPAAVHAQWRSSTMDRPSRLWVIEMEPELDGQGFYAPITTQFGYFGSPRSDSGEITGVNFSMWSFARGEDEPPIEQLSHIVGIGHPDGQFDGFDHEGTGAKIRGWNPYAGQRPPTQTLALRVDPGNPYDTFYGYYLDPVSGQWSFFGAGKKYNDGRPLDSLTAGAFVEVAGPPQRERTGQWERRMRYRGWYRDSEGAWHTIDTQEIGGSNALINKRWGIDGDQHWMSMGGLIHWQDEPGQRQWVLPNPPNPNRRPEHLQGDAAMALNALPARLHVEAAGDVQAQSAVAQFTVEEAGTQPRARIFWGSEDALTFADRWDHEMALDGVQQGLNSVRIDGLNPGTRYAYRVLISNDEGHMWTLEAGGFQTLQ